LKMSNDETVTGIILARLERIEVKENITPALKAR